MEQIKKNNLSVKTTENRIEVRFIDLPVEIETREDGKESRKIVGYAAVFNKWSETLFGYFREKINPNAFSEVMDDDAFALFNHDRNLVLARNKTTLSLSVDKKGLRYEFEAPNNTAGNDLIESLKRGDIKQSSFSFVVKEVLWAKTTSNDKNIDEDRTIMKIERLIDISPVTFPAYTETSAKVAKRSHDDFYEENREETDTEKNNEEVNTEQKPKIPANVRDKELELIEIQ